MTSAASPHRLRAAAAAFPSRTLGAVVFPGVQALDLWGPVEVFGDCSPAVRVLLVGEGDSVATAQGPRLIPDVTFDEAPRLDMLLVPGGEVRSIIDSTSLHHWLRTRSEDAEFVMSVCNGAEVLARTGVLDGRKATTNKALFARIAGAYPRVLWVARARWVEDGKFVTSSGVSAGIDMSFGVVARVAGSAVADGLATHLEYRRQSNPAADPFATRPGLDQPPTG